MREGIDVRTGTLRHWSTDRVTDPVAGARRRTGAERQRERSTTAAADRSPSRRGTSTVARRRPGRDRPRRCRRRSAAGAARAAAAGARSRAPRAASPASVGARRDEPRDPDRERRLDRRAGRSRPHRRRRRRAGPRRRRPRRAHARRHTCAPRLRGRARLRPPIPRSRGSATPGRAPPPPGRARPAPDGSPGSTGGRNRARPAKKRRRRRGGRGRSKTGGAERTDGARPERSPQRSAAAPSARYVDAGAQLTGVDVDGTALLDSLDSETLARRSGSHRKGRPAGRYLMVVHQRDDGIAHIAVLEGRTLVEHYVSMPTDDTLSIDGNIYLGRVQNVLPGHGSGVHRHRHAEERRAVPRRRHLRPGRRRRRPAAPHRERAAQRSVDHRAGDEEPDRPQGRAPHPRSEPRRPVRGDGARASRRPTGSRSGCPTTSASVCARCSTGCGPPTPVSSCAPRPKARPKTSSNATCSA